MHFLLKLRPTQPKRLVISHHNLTVDENISLARLLSIFQDVLLAITITQAATRAVINFGGSMVKVFPALELVVTREHRTSTTGATEAGRLVVVVIVGGLAVAEDAEQRTEGCNVADHHSDTIFCESPDNNVCDFEKVVGLAGEGDCVF